jgi:ankyrin repeat protein
MAQENDREAARQAVAELRAECQMLCCKKLSNSCAPPPPSIPDTYDKTNLYQVCRCGDLSALQTLIAQGVNVHREDGLALRLAAQNGHTDIVDCLLKQKVWIHSSNDAALRLAAQNGYFGTVDLLIEQGAPIEKLTPAQRHAYQQELEKNRIAVEQKLQQAQQSLTKIFNAKTWAGHVPEMIQLWSQAPEILKTKIDFSHLAAEAQIQTIKQKTKKIVRKK